MKIKWRRGMEVTPDIFEAQDRFNEAMTDSARRLSVTSSYGLLPDAEMNITTIILDEAVSLKVHALEAVTRSGRLLRVDGDSFSRSLPHAKGKSCYIVVRRDGDVEQEVNGVVYAKPRFAYDYCTIDEIGRECLPVAKLYMELDMWKVQELYVPPCLTLNAHPWLMQCMAKCKELVHRIAETLETKHGLGNCELLHWVMLELDDYSGNESPRQFYLVLKRVAWFLSTRRIEGVTVPQLGPFHPFDNNDFLICASMVIDYIEAFHDAVTAEDAPPKEEPKEDFIVYDGIIP